MAVFPQWLTPRGNIAIYSEGQSANIQIEALGNDSSTRAQYRLLNGNIPSGLTLDTNYIPPGTSNVLALISGTVGNVSNVINNQFTIRANIGNSFVDGTFTITVAGPDQPQWLNNQFLGNVLSGEYVGDSNLGVQLQWYDDDPGGNITIQIAGNSQPLPFGVNLVQDSGNYYLRGKPIFVDFDSFGNPLPVIPPPGDRPRYEAYQLTLLLQDGTYSVPQTFTLGVYNREYFTADSGNLTYSDRGYGTADNDYRALQIFQGNIDAAGYLRSNVSLSTDPPALIDIANSEFTFPNLAGNIFFPGNVYIAANVTSVATPNDYTYTLTYSPWPGVVANSVFYSTTVYTTKPFPGSLGYLARGLYSADMASKYSPIILSSPGAINPVQNGNFYAFKFNTYDPNGRPVKYRLTSGALPPGLLLDEDTGFIYGKVGPVEFDATFNFSIAAFVDQDGVEYVSDAVSYSIFVSGRRPARNQWITPFNVGVLDNGATSELELIATSDVASDFTYTLESGILPPGLYLSETGLIIGRVAFDQPTDFGGNTNYDFTARATSVNSAYDQVSFTGNFRINIINRWQPYNNLYIQAYPPQESQYLIENIVQDFASMPASQIYRYEDPNFGISSALIYQHAFGLQPANAEVYFNAMQENHYRRFLTVGPFKTAQARNEDGTVRYEVVYCQLIDNLVNNEGVSVGIEVGWPPNRAGINDVFPNSLDNMRQRIYDNITRVNKRLPLWMRSRQLNGKILGYVPAWVICYTKPRAASQIAYNLNQRWGQFLNKINFDLDRYELDDVLTWFYDSAANSWAEPYDTGYRITAVSNTGNVLTVQATSDGTLERLRPGDIISTNGNRTFIKAYNFQGYVTYVGNSTGNTAFFTNNGNTAQVVPQYGSATPANVIIGYDTVQDTVKVTLGNSQSFSNGIAVGSNIYVVNQYVPDNTRNKYLLFPHVNILG